MSLNDRMTRLINGTPLKDATTFTFSNPERSLIVSEWFTITGQTTEYQVLTSTSSSITFTPGLSANLSANSILTRFDKYAPCVIDDIWDYLSKEGLEDEGIKTEIYKSCALPARDYIENIVGHVFARSLTKIFSLNDASYYLPLGVLENISSITTLTIDETIIDSDEYSLTRLGSIYYKSGFPAGREHIEVVYVEGWSQIPFDIVQIYKDVCRILWGWSPQGSDGIMIGGATGIASPQLNTVIRTPDQLINYIQDRLSKYLRISV